MTGLSLIPSRGTTEWERESIPVPAMTGLSGALSFVTTPQRTRSRRAAACGLSRCWRGHAEQTTYSTHWKAAAAARPTWLQGESGSMQQMTALKAFLVTARDRSYRVPETKPTLRALPVAVQGLVRRPTSKPATCMRDRRNSKNRASLPSQNEVDCAWFASSVSSRALDHHFLENKRARPRARLHASRPWKHGCRS